MVSSTMAGVDLPPRGPSLSPPAYKRRPSAPSSLPTRRHPPLPLSRAAAPLFSCAVAVATPATTVPRRQTRRRSPLAVPAPIRKSRSTSRLTQKTLIASKDKELCTYNQNIEFYFPGVTAADQISAINLSRIPFRGYPTCGTPGCFFTCPPWLTVHRRGRTKGCSNLAQVVSLSGQGDITKDQEKEGDVGEFDCSYYPTEGGEGDE